MKTKTTLLFLVCAAFVLTCAKKDDQSNTDRRYVTASGGLNMRNAPQASAQPVLLIPENAEVIVLERVGEEVEISGRRGKWTKVRYNSQEGWVFGGFLEFGTPTPSKPEIPGEAEGTYHEVACPENPAAFAGIHFFGNAIHRTSCTGESACTVQTVEQRDSAYELVCNDINVTVGPEKWIFMQTGSEWNLTDVRTGTKYTKIRNRKF